MNRANRASAPTSAKTAKTLIILNPHAADGKAGRLWTKLEPLLWDQLGELAVAITQHPREVAQHLDKAHAAGLRRVIAIGGDGTNHALVNALALINAANAPDAQMIFGSFPIGTGRDWARGAGMPTHSLRDAAHWIARAQPHPTDLGVLRADGREGEYFLNIASAGMSGDVSTRVNRAARRPWTFLKSTVETLLHYRPQPITIRLDGVEWYNGRAYLVAVANGTTFGHGMRIAPDARVNDGLFDVVLVEAVSKLTILSALRRVYNGSHLTHPAVHSARAARVEITSPERLGMESDGEAAHGEHLDFSLRPAALQILGMG